MLEAGIVDRKAGIVCDAKSGVSGAGRKPSLKTSFCEATENFSAYSILKHRHVPEVLLTSGLEEREFSFTAQLLPVDRGILETIYFRLAQPLSGAEIVGDLRKAVWRASLLSGSMKPVMCPICMPWRARISAISAWLRTRRAGRCVVVSAIDNLVQRRGGPGDPESEPRAGVRGDGGLL